MKVSIAIKELVVAGAASLRDMFKRCVQKSILTRRENIADCEVAQCELTQ
jgi:hypothetical protein